MRKRLLFTTLVLAGMTSAMAQTSRPMTEMVPVKSVLEKPALVKVTTPKLMEWKNAVVTTRETMQFNRGISTRADVAAAFYAAPAGSFFTGINHEGNVSTATILNTPVECKPLFINYSTPDATIKWSISDGETTIPLTDVKNGNMTCDPVFGVRLTPLLEVTKGTATASYHLGKGSKSTMGLWYGGTDLISLSYADYGEAGLYGGFSGGRGFKTGVEFNGTGQKPVGFCTVYDKPLGHLYTRSMYMVVYSETADEGLPMADDVILTLNLRKLTPEGMFGDVIGEATATTADMSMIVKGMYYIRFQFTGKDEFGFPSPQPLNLGDSPLIALFTGFEKTKLSVTFAGAMRLSGNSFAILENGKIATIGYSDEPETPQINFHVGFEGAFPYTKILDGTDVATIPDGGGYGVTQIIEGKGYNDILLASSISLKDIRLDDNYTILECPEWISVEIDDSALEKNGIMLFYVKGEALPNGVKGRSDKVKIDVCGSPVIINVIQGNGGVGISDINAAAIKAICSGADFELIYPESVTTVSVVNVAGQVMSSYELPANGQFTIPAASFDKGLYLLKFNNNQTIKVIK